MKPLSFCLGRPLRQESLSRLAEQRRFDEIIEILQFKDAVGLSSWLEIGPKGNLKGEDYVTQLDPTFSSVLHKIMLYRPPVVVIEKLIQKLTEIKRGYIPEATVDGLNRTPLTIAVQSGCDISVVKCLTASSELPVFTMDSYGRFPLHWAVCFTSKRRGRGIKDNSFHTANHLMEIYPQAAIVPDFSGKTPLDLAVNKGTDKRIILGLTMVQQILHKSAPGSVERTTSTAAFSDVPHFVAHAHNDSDDFSSVGSCGISRHRRRTRKRVAI